MSDNAVFRDLFNKAALQIGVVNQVSEVGIHLLVFCSVTGMEFAQDLCSTEFGECVIELIIEDMPHFCRIDCVFDMWVDLVRGSQMDDELDVVALSSRVRSSVRPFQISRGYSGIPLVTIS
jgi:hypothetical protein